MGQIPRSIERISSIYDIILQKTIFAKFAAIYNIYLSSCSCLFNLL